MITAKDLNSSAGWHRLLLLLLLLIPVDALPQKYTIKRYTSNEGLPHNNVRELLSDSSGYLWLATWDGLSRYDGYEFKNYHHDPDDSTSIPYFSVQRIALDGSDGIWILSDNSAISRLDRATDKFIPITRINGERLPVSPNICSDENGDIWIISFRVAFRYDHLSRKFTKYIFRFPEGTDEIDIGVRFTITTGSDKSMWLAGFRTYKAERDDKSNTLTIKKIYSIKLRNVPQVKMLRNVDHASWYKYYEGKEGRKWIFSNSGLFILNEQTGTVTEFRGDIPKAEFTGRNFFCWGDQEGGMNIFRTASHSLIKVPGEMVQMLKFVTSQGKDIIWYSSTSFAGNSAGLSRLTFVPAYFRKYSDPVEGDEIPAVYSITTDNQKNVWLGIRGRKYLTLITPENRIIRKYTQAAEIPGYYGPPRCLINTPEGIWIGYFLDLLLFYDYRSEKITRFNPGPYMFRSLEIRDDGKLYMGNSNLIVFDPTTGKKEVIVDTIPELNNFRIKKDEKGVLWGGNPHGSFLCYDPIEKKARIIKTRNKSNNIEDVCRGDNDDVWLASLGGGLGRYNLATGSGTFYTTSNGMANNTVYSVLKDKIGNIWASTDNGISRLDPATGVIKNFGASEGLDIVEFNSGASYTDGEGRFYFGGMGGAVSFFPDSINLLKTSFADNKIVLSLLTVSGKYKALEDDLNRSDKISLSKGEDNFHLTIAVSDFALSEKTIFRYRLSGHDKEWIVTDHFNRNINYDNLKPGTYMLTIQATDRDGEWTIERTVNLSLGAYIYQNIYFKIGIILLITFIIFGMVMLYIEQLKQRSRQIQDGLRLQALRGQMNPHFIFNSLNSINYFISNNDKLSANRYISDFARLIRSILSNMGNDYVAFKGEISFVKDYLEIEHLRFGDKFDYTIDYSEVENPDIIEVFPGLIQPFIENAIWHGVRALEKRKGLIRIRMTGSDNHKLTCVVDDDGIGRKRSEDMRKGNENHESRGIAIVKERLYIISKLRNTNYNLEISDKYPGKSETGTKIEIDIPCRVLQ